VRRNDQVTVGDVERMIPRRSSSRRALYARRRACSMLAHQAFSQPAAILGVCSATRPLGEAFGGKSCVRCIMHGKTSPIAHDRRWHLLRGPLADHGDAYVGCWGPKSVPAELEVTAWTATVPGKRDMGLESGPPRVWGAVSPGIRRHRLREEAHRRNFLSIVGVTSAK